MSLHGPITGDNASANTPSEPSTSPITAPEAVKCRKIGGRATEVVVIENARPNAPSPSVQKRLRRTVGERAAASAVSCATGSGRSGSAVRGQPAADDLDDGALGDGDLVVAVGERSEHPARKDLFERAVEDEAD